MTHEDHPRIAPLSQRLRPGSRIAQPHAPDNVATIVHRVDDRPDGQAGWWVRWSNDGSESLLYDREFDEDCRNYGWEPWIELTYPMSRDIEAFFEPFQKVERIGATCHDTTGQLVQDFLHDAINRFVEAGGVLSTASWEITRNDETNQIHLMISGWGYPQ